MCGVTRLVRVRIYKKKFTNVAEKMKENKLRLVQRINNEEAINISGQN